MNGAKPPRGGEYLTYNLITHLRRDVFRPVLVYACEGPLVRGIKDAGIETICVPFDGGITGVYPREIKLYNPLFVLSFVWRLLKGRCVFKVLRLIRENDCYCVYCADNLSKLIGGIAGRIAGVKVVGHCHDDFKEDSLGRIMRFFYLHLLDRILVVSERVRVFFKAKGRVSPKAVKIYNGIDPAVFDPEGTDGDMRRELGISERAFVIGGIGALERDKGQRHLIDAVGLLKANGVNEIVCLVCGRGPEEQALKDMAVSKGVSGEIKFLGYRGDIPRILKILDAVVLTPMTIESFSMVAIEAMSMEVPVIATRVGGLPEVVEDGVTGVLVRPGDARELCEAIRHLIENTQLRRQMGKNGRRRVLERFTIDENVRRTEEVFLELLEAQR